MQSGFFKTYDGTRLFYQVEGSGPPLFFLYGLVCSKNHWVYQLEHFKKNYTTIWMDYRGHHNSALPENTSTITVENMARDAECLMDELGIKQVAALGHSIGVSTALALYHRAPSRVNSLVLANGCSRHPLENLLKTNISQFVHPLLFEMYKKAPKLMNLFWGSQKDNKLVQWIVGNLGFNTNLTKKEDIAIYIDGLAQMDMIVFLQLLKDYEEYDATPWLHQIHVPTMIIAGENDLITPRHNQELMHQLIQGSRYEVIPRGSHCPQLDLPGLVNITLDRFLEEVHSKL